MSWLTQWSSIPPPLARQRLALSHSSSTTLILTRVRAREPHSPSSRLQTASATNLIGAVHYHADLLQPITCQMCRWPLADPCLDHACADGALSLQEFRLMLRLLQERAVATTARRAGKAGTVNPAAVEWPASVQAEGVSTLGLREANSIFQRFGLQASDGLTFCGFLRLLASNEGIRRPARLEAVSTGASRRRTAKRTGTGRRRAASAPKKAPSAFSAAHKISAKATTSKLATELEGTAQSKFKKTLKRDTSRVALV